MKHLRFITLSFGVVMLLSSVLATNAQKADITAIEARAVELTKWIVKNSAFKFAKPPPVVLLPQATLTHIFGMDNMVQAAYYPGVILALDDFDLGVNDDVLLHELVHHLQFESGKIRYEKDVCTAPAEMEAYSLQNKFVREVGIGIEQDAMTLFMIASSC